MRDISNGEVLYFDYGKEYFQDHKTCPCASCALTNPSGNNWEYDPQLHTFVLALCRSLLGDEANNLLRELYRLCIYDSTVLRMVAKWREEEMKEVLQHLGEEHRKLLQNLSSVRHKSWEDQKRIWAEQVKGRDLQPIQPGGKSYILILRSHRSLVFSGNHYPLQED